MASSTAPPLPVPLYQGFFPQLVLSMEELMHYRRVGKERVRQLARVLDDADCVYRWADARAPRSGRTVQQTQFVDVRAATKSARPATLLKASVHLVDVSVDEILAAVARPKTRDARRMMSFLYGPTAVDTQTLLTFPTSSSTSKPPSHYRAIKWSLLSSAASSSSGGRSWIPSKARDFCYLEYAGRHRSANSAVVGFVIQESIAQDRQVPSLQPLYGVERGAFIRTGLLITKTHQSNILKVTSICQLDGSADRSTLEPILLEYVAAVHRVKALLERQRLGRLHYLEEWDWVAASDRKACAVCLRGFVFHRKHHCQTCGEVVCSTCAPLRELEEPLNDLHQLRVCSLCMAQAGSSGSIESPRSADSAPSITEDATSNAGTDTYVRTLKYPASYYRNGGGGGGLPRQRSSLSALPEHFGRPTAPQGGRKSLSSVGSTKQEALDKLVDHIRALRDTIDEAISEVGDPSQEVVERMRQLRSTLENAGELDAVLAAIERESMDSGSVDDGKDHAPPFSVIAPESDNSSRDSFSMLSSGSTSSLDEGERSIEQDAGETWGWQHRQRSPDPTDEPRRERSSEDKLHHALRWASQPDPMKQLPHQEDEPEEEEEEEEPVVSKPKGIERLALKIGRLQQRLDGEPNAATVEDPPNSNATARTSLSTRPSDPAKVPTDLVANLRGVMNSSELTHAPVRRRPSGPPPPPPAGAVPTPPPSIPPARAAPQPVAGSTIFVYDDGKLNKVERRLPRRSSLPEEPLPEESEVERAKTPVLFSRDESDELRELMEGLAQPARSRCSSGQSTGAPPTEKFDF